MINVTIAIKNSVVILLSFALIATILTLTNVGVNETGNASLSTVQQAEAFEISYDVAGVSPPAAKPSCTGACGPTKPTGSGGSGSVGVALPSNEQIKYYACATVNAAGTCFINNVVQQDTLIYAAPKCEYRLSNGGVTVASSGPAAVAYLKARLIGQWFNPYNSPERMYNHLTGAGLGILPWPAAWSDLRHGYNGTTAGKGEGPLNFFCKQFIPTPVPQYISMTQRCEPKTDGRPFPYAVGYAVHYVNNNTTVRSVTNIRLGGNDNYTGRLENRDWRMKGQNCIYVSPSTPPPKTLERTDKCFWNWTHSGYYSQNKAAILSGGTLTTNQPRYAGATTRAPYLTGDNSTAVLRDCFPNIAMNVSLSLNDGYAYYRLQGNARTQSFQTYVWDRAFTGGQRLVADIVAGPVGSQTFKAFGTHACTTPAYNSYSSWGALPNINFSYADCGRNNTWQCIIPHNPRINGVDNAVEVMRDGSYLRTELGGVNVSGGGVRDSFSKQVGTIADSNLSYMVKVESGSSPLNGTNPNATKQYFELWKSDKATETIWNTWLPQPNANKTSYLTYYWSSDNGMVWRMNYQAKINTGEFAVPFQDTTDGPSGTKWLTETNVDCNGVKVSNAATVLRSVTSEG